MRHGMSPNYKPCNGWCPFFGDKTAWVPIGVLFGCFGRNSRWRFLVLPGGFIIYRGNPSISPKRAPTPKPPNPPSAPPGWWFGLVWLDFCPLTLTLTLLMAAATSSRLRRFRFQFQLSGGLRILHLHPGAAFAIFGGLHRRASGNFGSSCLCRCCWFCPFVVIFVRK